MATQKRRTLRIDFLVKVIARSRTAWLNMHMKSTSQLTSVTPDFETELRQMLPISAFKEQTAPYFEENRGRWKGHGFVVAPASTQEVASVVTACAKKRVPIIPYGGGTGLVGGQLVEDGPRPVILSLERMNRIRETFAGENVLIVEAGAILADVQAEAERIDRLFPLSLASEGSARIGGLLATNAGGINTLRYGNARSMCLGLEVVRADGSVLNGLSRLRKDNTGYDLRNLMIGSEGTLGVITAASLQLYPRPTSVGTAIFQVHGSEEALELLALARQEVGEAVSAFEIIHKQGMEFLDEVGIAVRKPFAEQPEWMVLIELGLSAGANAKDVLMQLFEEALDAGLSDDGVVAQSESDRAAFWQLRELLPEANRRVGSISSHDISLPLSVIPDFLEKGGQALRAIGTFRINCFGHLGDGNLHYNVFPMRGGRREDHVRDRDAIKRAVHDVTHQLGGSVSAEHGVGRLKVDDLQHYGDPVKLQMLCDVKVAMDPLGILNPGAVLRQG